MNGMKEYIVPVHDTDWDEFKKHIGFIRTKPELIRCKDCKYYRPFITEPDVFHYCVLWSRRFKEDEYCARAEQKGEK